MSTFRVFGNLEQRIEREEKNWDQLPSIKTPEGIPNNYSEHLKIMFDMMVLLFKVILLESARFCWLMMVAIAVFVILECLRVTILCLIIKMIQRKLRNLPKLTSFIRSNLLLFAKAFDYKGVGWK